MQSGRFIWPGITLKIPLLLPFTPAFPVSPLYIQAGTHELLLSDIASFVDKARWSGAPVRFGSGKGCSTAGRHLPGSTRGEQAINLAGVFIRDVIVR